MPRLALTMGDPAGIGPEVAIKAIGSISAQMRRKIVVIGDRSALANLKKSKRLLRSYETGSLPPRGYSAFIDLNILPPSGIRLGKTSSKGGRASFAYIEKGVELCNNSELDGIITAPINKTALSLAGIRYPGHTEMLWDLSGKKGEIAMMFYTPEISVILLSTHMSLKNAIKAVKPNAILKKLVLIDNSIDTKKPIAVCGLNPHASENGLFGNEEEKIISPAIRAARRRGIRVEGPIPADTIFTPGVRNRYSAVLAMYHDQGLVGIKSLFFGKCANVTLGLPFIRTSVDHGTAYDIAGKGKANPSSMIFAIETAFKLAASK